MINIEHLLPLVSKPSRYIDHEINAVRKSFSAHPVRMLFAFPDVYELGISHLGLKILYSIINRLPYAMADRVYLPWLDLLDLMKKENLPLFGLESRVSAREFDVLGITLHFTMSTLGVAAPTQGGIGAWHFMVITSLLVYGVSWEEGSAFAGAVFTIQSAWLILIGIFSIFAIQYVKRDLPEKVEIRNSETND